VQNKFFIARRFLLTKDKGQFISIVSIVSSIAIAIGIASIIIVLSVMNGFESEIHKRIVNVEPHITIKSTNPIDYNPMEDLDLSFIEGKKVVFPSLESKGIMEFNGLTSGVNLKGIDLANNDALNAENYDQFNISELKARKIIIGKSLAYRMGVNIGDQIIIRIPNFKDFTSITAANSKSYQVIDVVEFGLGKYDSTLALLPMNELRISMGSSATLNSWSIRVDNPYQTSEYIQRIESAINNDQIIVSDWSNSNKPLFQAIMIEKTIMSVLIFLVVLIAMFNIMVMISMTVDDKEKDIAILRTLGFTSYDISQIFFLQGAMNATLGIILGIILAFLGLNNLQTIETFISVIFGFNFFPEGLYYISSMPYLIRTGDVIIISISALLISFIACYLPAVKASKQDPVSIIRFYRN
jgi:lipoprotein-releasing system permease protein|tara:strand:- start:6253 stop:7488 length:1236 start_codon:yes stop_codon:yes gene_type:complete